MISSFCPHVAAQKARLSLIEEVSTGEHPLCDVFLRVHGKDEEWVRVGSNSTFLRATSAVFEAIWQSDNSGNGVTTIDIRDCSEAAIRAMNAVAFGVYGIEITAENVAELLFVAKKYDIQLIAGCCEQFLEDVIAKKDVNRLLLAAVSFYEGNLKDYATRIVARFGLFHSKKTTAAFMCEAITAVPLSLFRDLLKDDALELSEEVIWTQVVKWAEHKYVLRAEEQVADGGIEDDCELKAADGYDAIIEILRPLKKYIRFPQMDHTFFMRQVAGIGLLTHSEVVAVCTAAVGLDPGALFCSAAPRLGVYATTEFWTKQLVMLRSAGLKNELKNVRILVQYIIKDVHGNVNRRATGQRVRRVLSKVLKMKKAGQSAAETVAALDAE